MMTVMMRCALAGTIGAALWAGPSESTNYAIDPAHSVVLFKVKHLNVSWFYGRFNDVSGTIVYDGSRSSAASIDVTVKTDSVDTNNAKREQHLKSPDFFNVRQYPEIRFRSTGVKASGDRLDVTGDLALHGVTKSITVLLQKVGEGKDPWGGYRIGFEGSFSIRRSEYGMNYMLEGLSDDVQITVALEAIRK